MLLDREQLNKISKDYGVPCPYAHSCCLVQNASLSALTYLDQAERAEAKLNEFETKIKELIKEYEY